MPPGLRGSARSARPGRAHDHTPLQQFGIDARGVADFRQQEIALRRHRIDSQFGQAGQQLRHAGGIQRIAAREKFGIVERSLGRGKPGQIDVEGMAHAVEQVDHVGVPQSVTHPQSG
jgi:hypothetical protein